MLRQLLRSFDIRTRFYQMCTSTLWVRGSERCLCACVCVGIILSGFEVNRERWSVLFEGVRGR